MNIVLRPYQQEAVASVYKYLSEHDDNPCVVTPTASGKSVMIAQIATDAVDRWHGRVLVLAHVKELLEQNAGKIRALCDGIEVGIYSAGLRRYDKDSPVIVAGIQSVYNKAFVLGKFDIIIIDECFPAGTIIDTPRGGVPIEDLYIGQPVYHALGVGNIEAISSRPTKELIQLELSNGKTIRCTRNHPFFTDRGWKKAEELERGSCLFSRQDVCNLRKTVSSKNMEKCSWRNMLFPGITLGKTEILLSGVSISINGCTEKTAYSYCKENSENMENRSVDCDKELSLLWERNATSVLSWNPAISDVMEQEKVLLNILLKESGESDVLQRNGSKGFNRFEIDWTQAENSRREWKPIDASAGTNYKSVRVYCGTGICCNNNEKTTERGRGLLLQVGHCDSVYSSGDSIGREQSFVPESAEKRQKDSCLDGRIRVVDITYIKLESPCAVYNLQIAGHPSYYADGILVHNCHLIPPDGEGMYRQFLLAMEGINPLVRVIGFTATPYRMKGGLICKPENILNKICYEVGIKEMIAHGYLSPLVSRAGKIVADFSDLHIRGGEFIADEVEKAMDVDRLVVSSCAEVVELTKDRKSVLIFATSIRHCQHIAERIMSMSGMECAVVTGDTPSDERAEIISRFKGEVVRDMFGEVTKPALKYLCNVNVLTTGFDAPNVDCVVLLRPTNSAGLLVQMVGRGFRLSPETGKKNCLVLDYGDNILRHGPIDCIRVRDRSSGNGEAPAKKCPECFALIHAAYSKCPECGYVFPPSQNTKLTASASGEGILSGEVTFEDFDVQNVSYEVHKKKNAGDDVPKTMKVTYDISIYKQICEWVCPEHTGYARMKFERWWRERAAKGCEVPSTAQDAVFLANEGALAEPESIRVRFVSGEKYGQVVGYKLKTKPESDFSQKEDIGTYADIPF